VHFFVAGTPVRDLLLRAKHLFVAAIFAILAGPPEAHTAGFRLTKNKWPLGYPRPARPSLGARGPCALLMASQDAVLSARLAWCLQYPFVTRTAV
jgi:hypothetical protein